MAANPSRMAPGRHSQQEARHLGSGRPPPGLRAWELGEAEEEQQQALPQLAQEATAVSGLGAAK